MIDFTIFYKSSLPPQGPWGAHDHWDVLLSAFTGAERVRQVFENVRASEKHWLVFPEYGYQVGECASDRAFVGTARNEGDYIRTFWQQRVGDLNGRRLCIDMTGFIRPYLLFLLRWLQAQGVLLFDLLYSEPVRYAKGEETRFSDEAVVEVRQVVGYEGQHSTDTSRDILIIGSGYDHKLIAEVAESKDEARKIQMFGLPSLRADMYQENVLRAYRAEEAVGFQTTDEASTCFAPANDPFVTASVLQEMIYPLVRRNQIGNLYLCPLATKPQVLGFALYYLWEGKSLPCSILYPFTYSYSRETSKGIARIWKYTVQLPTT